MAQYSNEKGRILEDAIESIERFIHLYTQIDKNDIIEIERNKVFTHENVKHEIDLIVTVDKGFGYRCIFLFECKNTEAKIGKNPIIEFTEKINALQATKGFFVATGFGRYAIAQAKKDKRIELVLATEVPNSNPLLGFARVPIRIVNCFYSTVLNINATFFCKDLKVEFDNSTLAKHEVTEPLEETVGSMIKAFIRDHYSNRSLAIGEYAYKDLLDSSLGSDLFIGEQKIDRVVFEIEHLIHIVPPVILWHFNVEKRGKVAAIKYSLPNNNSYSLKLTSLNTSETVWIEGKGNFNIN